MAHRIVRPRRGGIARRETAWIGITPTTNALNATAVVSNVGSAGLLAMRPFTIVRVHMVVHIESDQNAGSETQVAAIGMCVVSDQASGIGVTAVPTPETDDGSDLWLMHQWLLTAFRFNTAVGIEAGTGHVFSVDSKAMRKVNDDQDILVVKESNTIAGGGSTITSAGRMLIKLH